MSSQPELLLTFYGDDFTGSTDAMESLSLSGIRTVLFLDPPSQDLLKEKFKGVQAVGVAGISRSLTPEQMEESLPPVFEKISEIQAPLFHYKFCSTFDSSPQIGSIGRAIDIAQNIFKSPFMPVIVGAPVLRRYCMFGNLYATVGADTFRIDRHPTMKQHPVTPMHESDLRLHLGKQTNKSIALFDILQLSKTRQEIDHLFQALLIRKPEIIFFDVLDDERLAEAGRIIWESCQKHKLFSPSSSGLGYALTAYWKNAGIITSAHTFSDPGPVDKIAVVSGSCSPVTMTQIQTATDHGFTGIKIDTIKIVNPKLSEEECNRVIESAIKVLKNNNSVVIYSSLGPEDPSIDATNKKLNEMGEDKSISSKRIGEKLGVILKTLIQKMNLKRAIAAGGDTSGYVSRELGIFALEMIKPIDPGSPLCKVYSNKAEYDGLQIALKGGQVGQKDYFLKVLK